MASLSLRTRLNAEPRSSTRSRTGRSRTLRKRVEKAERILAPTRRSSDLRLREGRWIWLDKCKPRTQNFLVYTRVYDRQVESCRAASWCARLWATAVHVCACTARSARRSRAAPATATHLAYIDLMKRDGWEVEEEPALTTWLRHQIDRQGEDEPAEPN